MTQRRLMNIQNVRKSNGEKLPKEFVFKLLEIGCVDESVTNLEDFDVLFKADWFVYI